MLRDLPPDLADDTGLTRWRSVAVDDLAGFDDGAPTLPGFWAD